MKKAFFSFIILQIAFCLNAQNEAVRFPRFFSEGMVLQRETTVPFWGWSKAGSKIEVTASWNNIKVETVAATNGKWQVNLTTPVAGGPFTIKVNQSTIKNVKIGEVWVCAGQSNMKLRLGETDVWTVSGDSIDNIRVFEVPQVRSLTPQDSITGGIWRHGVISNNMQHISAVGYYFARKLESELHVPIGMIGIYEGGTNAEEWTSPAVFNSLPTAIKSSYGNPTGNEPGCLYNAMVNPVLPYKISGFIWYQGENNVSRQNSYSVLLQAMVAGWRKDFQNNFLPFYIVQLPTFSSDWTVFREIQQNIVKEIPNSGMVVTMDVGDPTNIHPTTKKPVGDRLGDIALGKVYGLDKTTSSPIYRQMKIEENKIRIYFNFADKGLKIISGDSPQLFEIAGTDNIYQIANAKIEGNTILLWSDKVVNPQSARYFWKSYAVPNTFSSDNYPIAPFRTKK